MTDEQKNVACITTTYFPISHADVIVGRLLGDYDYEPSVNVVSLYTDQVSDEDISREKAAEAGIPIYPTIYQAIEAGGTPVDGVLVIGEHGEYPWTVHGQKMYPRRRLNEEVIDALDRLNLRVPVFNDKHFAYDMDDATWIYRQYKERGVPFFGGSSTSLQEKLPTFDRSALLDAREILVCVGGGRAGAGGTTVVVDETPVKIKAEEGGAGVDSYGFHAMEVLQSLAEGREGGETGVESVEPFEGCGVWAAADRGDWPETLMDEALAHNRSELPGHPREHVAVPALFKIRYRDGLTAYVLMLEQYTSDSLYAVRTGSGDVISGYCNSGKGYPYRHFDVLVEKIEELVITGEAPIPPERLLMTTGLIDLSMEALGSLERRATPELGFSYEV